MEARQFNYQLDKITGQWRPGQYPSDEKADAWILPEDIRSEYSRLNSQIETKYSREYLKICAYYNKLFPALRSSGWITSSYNVPPFTTLEQERADTGTGISSNYLKQIGDQTVARIGTITFEPALISEVPTLEYIIYKDEVERLMRKMVKDVRLVKLCMEVFHDAMIVGFSHVIIDPVTYLPFKANDYEIGMFESQFTNDAVTQCLYRNYRFPVTSLVPYLKDAPEELKQKIIDQYTSKDWCDFKMYFDCPAKRVVLTIGSDTLPDIPYPFDKVQMVTFGWDIGFSRVTASSLFDLLYPSQRELNRVNAKIQQLIRLYKGALPVFNNDVDLAMKNITNGSGECLYVDSSRPIDSLMTVINPTPLDAQLTATKTELKTEMYELAGLQSVQFDKENFRSAAAAIAMDQFNDTIFQAQMTGMAAFVRGLFETQVHFNAAVLGEQIWIDTDGLIADAQVVLKPVMATNPLGTKNTSEGFIEPDYTQMAHARAVIAVIKGDLEYDAMPYMLNKSLVLQMVAQTSVKMTALGVTVPDSVDQFLIAAFIDNVRMGIVQL